MLLSSNGLPRGFDMYPLQHNRIDLLDHLTLEVPYLSRNTGHECVRSVKGAYRFQMFIRAPTPSAQALGRDHVEAIRAHYTEPDSSSSYVSPIVISDDEALFVEANEGSKKGRVYGLGSESSRVRRRYE